MEADEPESGEALWAELHARCEIVTELDPARIEGLVSGLFAAWDSDADAVGFVEWCRARPGPVSALVCAALAELAEAELAEAARRAYDSMASHVPPAASSLGRFRAVQAWRVEAGFGSSIVIGFAGADSGIVDHALMAELDDDELLVDLQLAPPPQELLDGEIVGERGLEVTGVEVGQAVELVRAGWVGAHGRIEPSPTMLANQQVARRRLDRPGADQLPRFDAHAIHVDLSRGMSDDEIARADAAALSTLTAALGVPGDEPAHPAWVQVVTAAIPELSAREREALLWLEWADWLGVGIGLTRGADRSGSGTALVPGTLVDLVNRCPEVSSTIHADDRDYAEWAFSIALEHLADHGLVVDGVLTDLGRAAAHPSLVAAWQH